MSNKSYRKNSQSGFTLVEMLVAIAVFMVVMVVAVGALISIIDANKKAQSIKNVINNVNFAMESISKDMRVGTNYSCGNGDAFESNCPEGDVSVRYLSNSGNYVKYRFVESPDKGEGNIQRCIQEEGTCTWVSLTAPTSVVLIRNMRFYVIGVGQGDGEQPRVIITVDGIAGNRENLKTTFNLQTTVSQRAKE